MLMPWGEKVDPTAHERTSGCHLSNTPGRNTMATATHFFRDRSRVGEPIFPDLQFVTDVFIVPSGLPHREGRLIQVIKLPS